MSIKPTSRRTGALPTLLSLLLALAPPALAQDPGAAETAQAPVLTYADRGVELVRAHRELLPESLFGAELEPYDYLATGRAAVAELRLATGDGAVELRLEPDSAVMLHPGPMFPTASGAPAAPDAPTAPTLVVELLHGSLSFEAQAAAPLRVVLREGTIEAAAAAGAVGRGPLGGIRVEGRSGRLVVRLSQVEAGRLFATSERWVLYDPERGTAENTDAAGGMGSWRASRLTVAGMAAGRAADSARPDAAAATRESPAGADRVATYEDARAAFDAAYARAIEAEPAILRWMRDADAARALSPETAARLGPTLGELEEARREFEPLFFEQIARRAVVPNELVPGSVVEDGRIITERLHTTRHLLRLLTARGEAGAGGSGDGATDDRGSGDGREIPATGM